MESCFIAWLFWLALSSDLPFPFQKKQNVEVQLTLCRQTLDVHSFGCQKTEAGIDVLDLDREGGTDTAVRLCAEHICIQICIFL